MEAVNQLIETVRKLRDKETGCPWDSIQTHESLKPFCIEEACEVICGINNFINTGNSSNLKEELGDLLFQVLIHSIIAEEEGLFTFEDVVDGINEKMICRHPGVFNVETLDENGNVLKTWSDIKRHEKKGKEWLDENIFDAFLESKELIDIAYNRKNRKNRKEREECAN